MKDKYVVESETREKRIEKEIKDIFIFMKDQKLLQHKINEDFQKQLKELKESIEKTKSHLNSHNHDECVELQKVPDLEKKIE